MDFGSEASAIQPMTTDTRMDSRAAEGVKRHWIGERPASRFSPPSPGPGTFSGFGWHVVHYLHRRYRGDSRAKA
jgi:hypothetical protein